MSKIFTKIKKLEHMLILHKILGCIFSDPQYVSQYVTHICGEVNDGLI